MKSYRKTQWVRILGAAVIGLALAGWAGAEEDAQRGPRGGHGMGRGMGMRREGGRMRKFIEENLPGAKEEMERHQEALEALREKGRKLAEETREKVKAAEGREAKEAVINDHKDQVKALATEFVDENLRHAEKMLDLRKANREEAIEKWTEHVLDSAKGRMRGGRGGGMRRGRDDDEQGMGPRQKRRGAPSESNAPQGGPEEEYDIARALEQALQ